MLAIIYFFSIFFSTEQTIFQNNEPVIFTLNIDADSVKAENTLMYEEKLLEFQRQEKEISEDQYKERKSQIEITKDHFAIVDSVCWKNKAVVEFYSINEKEWGASPQPVHLLDSKLDSQQVSIEKNQTYYIDWGIDPEDVQKLKPGSYSARTRVIALNESSGQTDTLFSKPVSFSILKEKLPVDAPEYLKQLSIYFTRRGLYEKAMEYARQYNEQAGDEYTGSILQAEIFELMGDYDKALEIYISVKGESSTLPHQYKEYLNYKIQTLLSISPESINKLINVEDGE